MKFTGIAKTILALSASGFSVDAVLKQRNLQTICSCAPQAFSFTLLLAQDCAVNTLQANPGISDTNCAIVNATTDAALLAGDDQMIAVAGADVPLDEILACIPWINRCEESSFEEPIRERELQTGSPIPSFITSIQFIELDSSGTVIQIDDSQNNINAVSGDTFSYASRASQLDPTQSIDTQLGIVPKTAVLFLVGFNDDGDEIRGRFVWEYTNGCGDDELTVIGGEDYAWISFDQVERASPEFCPALNDETPAPTPAPFIIDIFPTPPPAIDTPLPTPSPTILESPEPTLSPVATIPTDSPSALLFPSFSPTTAPTIEESPTPNPVIIDFFPTASPVVAEPPTPSPSELFFPTFAPSDMGQLPTTRMPVTDEPTYTTDVPTYFEPTTPSPTTFYGYGEDYNVAYTVDSKSGKRGSKAAKGNQGTKSSKSSRGSKSGKGSKKTSSSAKSGKSSGGGHKYGTEFYYNKDGYERNLKEASVGLKQNMLRRKK